MIIIPYGSMRAYRTRQEAGSAMAMIRLPSSGGIGIRLKTARTAFIHTLNQKRFAASTKIGLKSDVRHRYSVCRRS